MSDGEEGASFSKAQGELTSVVGLKLVNSEWADLDELLEEVGLPPFGLPTHLLYPTS